VNVADVARSTASTDHVLGLRLAVH
jgi:hypothetical protein